MEFAQSQQALPASALAPDPANCNCHHNGWPSSYLLLSTTNGCTYSTFAFASAPPCGIAFSYFPMGKIHLALPQYLHIIVGSTNELASVREALWVCACVCRQDRRTCVQHVSAKWMRRVELNHRSLLPNSRIKYSLRSKSEATKIGSQLASSFERLLGSSLNR